MLKVKTFGKWISKFDRGCFKVCVSFWRIDAVGWGIIQLVELRGLFYVTLCYVGCGEVYGWNMGRLFSGLVRSERLGGFGDKSEHGGLKSER